MSVWLTLAEAGERVGRGESTIRRWCSRGLQVKLGRVRESDLLTFEKRMRESRGRPRGATAAVLAEVAAHRATLEGMEKLQSLPDGTGPGSRPLQNMGVVFSMSAGGIAVCARDSVDELASGAGGRSLAWADVLLDCVFRTIAERTQGELRTGLVATAALAVAWVEAIDRRSA